MDKLSPFTVLVVGAEQGVCELLEDYLGHHGFRVLSAADAVAARAVLERHPPHLLVLDADLAGDDGFWFLRFVRENFEIGIVMVSESTETVDRIVGLEVGADDYLAKPFDLRELRARLHNLTRRYWHSDLTAVGLSPATSRSRVLALGRTQLNLDSHQLFDDNGHEIPLSTAEFELLQILAARPNRPLSRNQLMMLTRHRDWDPLDRSIDIQIARLRKKIELEPAQPCLIKTVRGIGYMFVPERHP